MGKAFEKQTETIEDEGKNQISAKKESGKQIIQTNEISKNDFNTDRSIVSLYKKNIFYELVRERI